MHTMPPPLRFGGDELVTVALTGPQAHAYQDWLRSRGLYLHQIPDTDVYAIGVSEELAGRD